MPTIVPGLTPRKRVSLSCSGLISPTVPRSCAARCRGGSRAGRSARPSRPGTSRALGDVAPAARSGRRSSGDRWSTARRRASARPGGGSSWRDVPSTAPRRSVARAQLGGRDLAGSGSARPRWPFGRASRSPARLAPVGGQRRAPASGSDDGSIWTTTARRLCTMTLPLRSTILPRGAWMRSSRTRFTFACGEELVARQHLQVPEAEEDDREQRERDAAEDRDAQRELRRDRRRGGRRTGSSCADPGPREQRAQAAGRVGAAAAAARVLGQRRAAASGARARRPAAR